MAGEPADAAAAGGLRWQDVRSVVAQAWLHLRYWASLNFCAAEDLPLVEAAEFFCDCLPHSNELTIAERLRIMNEMRASVHDAVRDLYVRQQEQRRRAASRSHALHTWQRAHSRLGGGGGGGDDADPLAPLGGDAEESEVAARTASLAMAIYAERFEQNLHYQHQPRPPPAPPRRGGSARLARGAAGGDDAGVLRPLLSADASGCETQEPGGDSPRAAAGDVEAPTPRARGQQLLQQQQRASPFAAAAAANKPPGAQQQRWGPSSGGGGGNGGPGAPAGPPDASGPDDVAPDQLV